MADGFLMKGDFLPLCVLLRFNDFFALIKRIEIQVHPCATQQQLQSATLTKIVIISSC